MITEQYENDCDDDFFPENG